MQPRTYGLSLAALAGALFLAVVGANLIIDPEEVFGTGIFHARANVNARYQVITEYEAAAGRYDGLLFGSSRGGDVPIEELHRGTGGVTFARFAVNHGQMTDHLPTLEYVVKHKRARRESIRVVFLLLDIDSFGDRPKTNNFIQTMLPPALTGESAARFWWKNLAAIQFQAWRASLRGDSTGGEPLAQELNPTVADPNHTPITKRFAFQDQLTRLERFVALCREHGISLVVATSPLHRYAGYTPHELAEAVDRISAIVPVWDFSNADWLSDRPQFWRDVNHFRSEVGSKMLGRIFRDELPDEWKDFGRLVQPPTPATAQ